MYWLGSSGGSSNCISLGPLPWRIDLSFRQQVLPHTQKSLLYQSTNLLHHIHTLLCSITDQTRNTDPFGYCADSQLSTDLQKFHEHIAKGVFHNSQKCSEEANPWNVNNITHQWRECLRRMPIPSDSRDSLFNALVVEDVIKDIFIWLHDPSTHCLAMWVYDDDRSLTSLIGQAVAKILAKWRELSVTYFFPREQLQLISRLLSWPLLISLCGVFQRSKIASQRPSCTTFPFLT